ncbi:MAG: hypothetical protein JJ897_14915 [Marinibacterium sp.]|nr:hypothetical protein [Marinibacterium sp.]
MCRPGDHHDLVGQQAAGSNFVIGIGCCGIIAVMPAEPPHQASAGVLRVTQDQVATGQHHRSFEEGSAYGKISVIRPSVG